MNLQGKGGIGYCDATWNPVTGCEKRCSYCYAQRWANGRLRKLYLSNSNVAPGCDPDDPFSPRFWPKRLDEPLKRRRPARIFVVDMGDLFHPGVPEEWIHEVLAVAGACPQHTFLYLTKNPAGYPRNWLWEDNEWLGTTVTNQSDWDERWLMGLAGINARVRWVSFEPLLGPVCATSDYPDWAVIGALTGRQARQPEPEWVRHLVEEDLDFWGTPVFLKDNLDCEGMGIERRREMPR